MCMFKKKEVTPKRVKVFLGDGKKETRKEKERREKVVKAVVEENLRKNGWWS